MTPDVVCVGTATVDILVKGFDGGGLFKNEMLPAENITISSGGDPLNEAVILSRLGKKVRLCSLAGNDTAGRILMEVCDKEGIDTGGVEIRDEFCSSSTVVLIRGDGERTFISNMFGKDNIVSAFDASAVSGEMLSGAKVLSFGSLFINPAMNDDALCSLFKKAKREGLIICSDMVGNPSFGGFQAISSAAGMIDYIFPNLDEGRLFSQKEEPDDVCDYFLDLGVNTVVLKLGKKGALIRTKNERIEVPAFLTETVDTTGAGDSFAAGFICALCENKSLYECGLFAAATASLIVSAVGSNAGLKDRKQVEEVLKCHL